MDKIPTEIVSHIFSFLELPNQLQLATVSGRWRVALEDCLRRRRWLTSRHLRRRCTDETLRTILRRLPGLYTLHVYGQDLNIDIVSQHCRHLENLDLSSFTLDAASVTQLCRRCPRLSTLTLPKGCSAACLESLLNSRLPGLRTLHLQHTTLTAECVALLPAGLQRLSLTACHLPALPPQSAARWPLLRELNLTLSDAESHLSMSALMSGCPSLERLDADCSEATDDVLQQLPALSQLQHLHLPYCHELTEAGLAGCLGRLKRIQALDLTGLAGVTDSVLGQLAGTTSLSKLALGVEVYYQAVEFSMDALLRLVLACPSLTSLQLALWEVQPMMALIAGRLVLACPSLTSLQLALWEVQPMMALIDGLARQLSPERDVTLQICETILEELDQSVLPSGSRPLRLITF